MRTDVRIMCHKFKMVVLLDLTKCLRLNFKFRHEINDLRPYASIASLIKYFGNSLILKS